ncbi:MAG: class I SAM-dependent methyltransferase [Candidatus Rokuibacteriota bacterium]|nr:MAG: class I SAM-dependent methyltransferase [Candidatus Rokubacteria bacterium]
MNELRRTAGRVSGWSRRRKLELFMQELSPTPATTVLDVGVTDSGPDPYGTHNFFEALYPWPERITAVSTQYLDRFAESFPAVRAVRADGRKLPFADAEFDLGFSNAVLEHVGDQDDQRAFVHELCRVARRVFLATPNRWFPLDSHTLVPFAHWLPREQRERVYRALGADEGLGVELLSSRALLALFPAGSRPRLVRRGMSLVVIAGA